MILIFVFVQLQFTGVGESFASIGKRRCFGGVVVGLGGSGVVVSVTREVPELRLKLMRGCNIATLNCIRECAIFPLLPVHISTSPPPAASPSSSPLNQLFPIPTQGISNLQTKTNIKTS